MDTVTIGESKVDCVIKRVFYNGSEMVLRNKKLVVKAPVWKSKKEVLSSVYDHRKWIEKRIQGNDTYILGGKLVYLGNDYKKEIVLNTIDKQSVYLYDDTIAVITNSKKEKCIKKIVEEWLKDETERIVKDKIQLYKGVLNVEPNHIYVEKLFNRWGSCSNFGNMKFNIKCSRLPDYIIDYVVVHELCHLRFLNHSKEFWDLVARVMPDWERRHYWLNKNGESYIR